MAKSPITANARVKRTHTIKLRVTEHELAVVRELSANTAIAVFIREQLLGGEAVTAKQHRRKKPASNGQDANCAALARQVALIGNNLNQIARAANLSIKDNKAVDLVIVAIRLQGIWRELNVLQNIQARQGGGDRYRLLNESERCQWAAKNASSTVSER